MPQLRIASVPEDHVYIRHCAALPEAPQPFVRLPDPKPNRADGTEQSGWWPPAMLEPGWIEQNAERFDLMHLHFGFDALSPEDLQRVLDDLRRHGKQLVYTVHDLANPHHTDPTLHAAALDVLIPQADALITLTAGAAAEIQRRWGRNATVLPHPHVVELEELRRRQAVPRQPNEPRRIGIHLKSLRPNMAPQAVVDGLVTAADAVPGVVIQVNTHPEVMEGGGHQASGELGNRLRALADAGRIDLQVHPYFDEDQLWDYLGSLDASVLPYRWGTHSGWLEACLDLGTAVIAPDCGFYAEQGPVQTFHLDRDGLDQESLTAAVAAVAAMEAAPQLSVPERLREREFVSGEHDRIYRGLLR